MISPKSDERQPKLFETRDWRTPYRGPIAIHASKGEGDMYLCDFENYRTTLARGGYNKNNLPLGALLGVAQLVNIFPTETIIGETFGNFAPGRWAWQMEFVERFPTPISWKGNMGLWEWVFDRSLIK